MNNSRHSSAPKSDWRFTLSSTGTAMTFNDAGDILLFIEKKVGNGP
jgi:hypothetical protein